MRTKAKLGAGYKLVGVGMKKTVVRRGLHKFELKHPGEYVYELVESGAEVEVVGVFVGGKQKTENNEQKKENRKQKTMNDKIDRVVCEGGCGVKVTVVHKAPNTRAETTLKGVGYGKAKIRFEGRIVVEKGCPGVNSFLTEKILLLSDGAKAEAIPDLEIESDDVKCSHAATVSHVPEEQVFYLMSRGVSRKKAEELIVSGFLSN